MHHTLVLQVPRNHGDVELALKTTVFYKMGASYCTLHIAVKEMVPVIVAAIAQGHHWKGRQVVVGCDNIAVATALKIAEAMQMLRALFLWKPTIVLKWSLNILQIVIIIELIICIEIR